MTNRPAVTIFRTLRVFPLHSNTIGGTEVLLYNMAPAAANSMPTLPPELMGVENATAAARTLAIRFPTFSSEFTGADVRLSTVMDDMLYRQWKRTALTRLCEGVCVSS